jgi:hypothetical protein
MQNGWDQFPKGEAVDFEHPALTNSSRRSANHPKVPMAY